MSRLPRSTRRIRTLSPPTRYAITSSRPRNCGRRAGGPCRGDRRCTVGGRGVRTGRLSNPIRRSATSMLPLGLRGSTRSRRGRIQLAVRHRVHQCDALRSAASRARPRCSTSSASAFMDSSVIGRPSPRASDASASLSDARISSRLRSRSSHSASASCTASSSWLNRHCRSPVSRARAGRASDQRSYGHGRCSGAARQQVGRTLGNLACRARAQVTGGGGNGSAAAAPTALAPGPAVVTSPDHLLARAQP